MVKDQNRAGKSAARARVKPLPALDGWSGDAETGYFLRSHQGLDVSVGVAKLAQDLSGVLAEFRSSPLICRA